MMRADRASRTALIIPRSALVCIEVDHPATQAVKRAALAHP